MPRVSKDSAPNVQDFGLGIDRGGQLDDDTQLAEVVAVIAANAQRAMPSS